jgi:hypothetical protein
MKPGEIDQYIVKFEELACHALYMTGDLATTSLFLKGLLPGVLVDVFKPPTITAYEDIKEQAIQSTRSRALIDSILGSQRAGPARPPTNRGGFQGGAFQSFQNYAAQNNQNNSGQFPRSLPPPPQSK